MALIVAARILAVAQAVGKSGRQASPTKVTGAAIHPAGLLARADGSRLRDLGDRDVLVLCRPVVVRPGCAQRRQGTRITDRAEGPRGGHPQVDLGIAERADSAATAAPWPPLPV
jgi:hypothetical protein